MSAPRGWYPYAAPRPARDRATRLGAVSLLMVAPQRVVDRLGDRVHQIALV